MTRKKRNITMIAVLLFVVAAVALNYRYNHRWGSADTDMVAAVDQGMAEAIAEYYKNDDVTETGYFAEARLTRQVSRDEALNLLQTAASSESASQETIDTAMNAISTMATRSMQESQIENLLIAKDFSDCVVYIADDAITVAVPSPLDGLTEEAVARITDIICTETNYKADQLNIIEVK